MVDNIVTLQISLMVKEEMFEVNLLVILGPTATGKTQLAVQLANKLEGEIISADSRQVYRGMNIGTGKDLGEYKLQGRLIPYHLIDIVDPSEEYNVAQFQKDYEKVSAEIRKRKKLPILCGGTGLYLKAVLLNFQLPTAEPNQQLREKLEFWTFENLIKELETISPGASVKTPLDTKRRVIRAIEVAKSREKGERKKEKGTSTRLPTKISGGGQASSVTRVNEHRALSPDPITPIVLGIDYPREVIRERITTRLHYRFDNGMIEEVQALLKNGVTHERLDSFGLEYRFINHFLLGELKRDEMVEKLNTAIHRFAKKQMTFFRNMEKNGVKIHWIPEGDFETSLNLVKK